MYPQHPCDVCLDNAKWWSEVEARMAHEAWEQYQAVLHAREARQARGLPDEPDLS